MDKKFSKTGTYQINASGSFSRANKCIGEATVTIEVTRKNWATLISQLSAPILMKKNQSAAAVTIAASATHKKVRHCA